MTTNKKGLEIQHRQGYIHKQGNMHNIKKGTGKEVAIYTETYEEANEGELEQPVSKANLNDPAKPPRAKDNSGNTGNHRENNTRELRA